MIINKSGLAIRMGLEAVRVMGRATQGVTLIKLNDKDEIAAVAKVAIEEEEEGLDVDGEVIETQSDETSQEDNQTDSESTEETTEE